jgi:hypothetical protein
MKGIHLIRRSANIIGSAPIQQPYSNFQTLDFATLGQYFDVPITVTNEITITFWAKNEATNFYNGNWFYYLDSRPMMSGGYLTSNETGPSWEYYLDGAYKNRQKLADTVVLNEWQRFVLVSTSPVTAGGSIIFNSRFNRVEGVGKISFADLRIYNRILSSEEISSGEYLSNGLTNHYDFATHNGSTLPDISGNGRHGVLYNIPPKQSAGSVQNDTFIELDETSIGANLSHLETINGLLNKKGGLIPVISGNPKVIKGSVNNFFNGYDFVDFTTGSIGAVQIPSFNEGITIINVCATIAGMSNGDGTMIWYIDDSFGPFDLWTISNTNTALVLNTFGGTQFGHNFGTPIFDKRVIATRLPANNTRQSAIFQNGVKLPVNTDINNVSDRSLVGNLYPVAFVPPATGYSFYGFSAAVYAYPRLLSDAEIVQATNVLKTKYGIT